MSSKKKESKELIEAKEKIECLEQQQREMDKKIKDFQIHINAYINLFYLEHCDYFYNGEDEDLAPIEIKILKTLNEYFL